MPDTEISTSEKVFTALWHLGLAVFHFAAIPLLPQRKAKWMSAGAGVWHLDAFVNDWRGTECYLKRGIRRVVRVQTSGNGAD